MSSVITTKNLSRHFQDGENIIKAVDDVSLNIEAGEFTAIIGPSGSGKSTLLNLIGGLDNPTSGAVELS
ncbi:MAG: ATP-binding cassette domain-containing protein, partial [Pseudomonadales bacterium]|nr:ATP-binding cassette domain-containing protein [Pseudomonadales bacterium]